MSTHGYSAQKQQPFSAFPFNCLERTEEEEEEEMRTDCRLTDFGAVYFAHSSSSFRSFANEGRKGTSIYDVRTEGGGGLAQKKM